MKYCCFSTGAELLSQINHTINGTGKPQTPAEEYYK